MAPDGESSLPPGREKNVLFTKYLPSHELPAPAELIVKTVILDDSISCFKAGWGEGLQTAFQLQTKKVSQVLHRGDLISFSLP